MSLLSSALLLLAAAGAPLRGPSDPRATALVDRAMTVMGGEAALRGVTSLRIDLMTQWQRAVYGAHPYADAPSYERSVELRDYANRLWRSTRQFFSGNPGASIVDIVRDTVGAIGAFNGQTARWTPLSVAYADERREIFAFAPERMLVLAKDAGGLALLADTTIDGVAHARVSATIDGFRSTLFLRRTDGLPAFVRFRADETNDFGLAPWGEQEVEFWYSAWTRVPPGVLLPRQRDVRRIGRPYKRMTALAMTVNAPVPADSFAIADSLVAGFFATQNRPMWDAPLDTMRITAEHFLGLPPFLGTSGAVRVGGAWVMLETGQAAGAAAKVAARLRELAPGETLAGGIVSMPSTSNGGMAWFAKQGIPVWMGPGAVPLARAVLGRSVLPATMTPIAAARWVRVGTDSLWLEPITYPDVRGALAVYSPTYKWLYLAAAGSPMLQAEQDALVARLRAKGMAVERIGSSRAIVAPLPAAK